MPLNIHSIYTGDALKYSVFLNPDTMIVDRYNIYIFLTDFSTNVAY